MRARLPISSSWQRGSIAYQRRAKPLGRCHRSQRCPLRDSETPIYFLINTANGSNSLARNTTGINNTATGEGALFLNTTGSQNTADGVFALGNNIDGSQNTATGFEALIFNIIGASNTSVGHNSLLNNTIGSNNIAVGASAGMNLTTGNANIAIGNAGVAGRVPGYPHRRYRNTCKNVYRGHLWRNRAGWSRSNRWGQR